MSNEYPFHMPAKPDRFEFDAEVSKIFPDMARRSLPNYETFHELHASIAVRRFLTGGRLRRVLDVGASHGAFLTAVEAEYKKTGGVPGNITLVASDVSPDMCQYLKAALPEVEVRCEDVLDQDFGVGESALYDVINCTYVVQFVKPERQIPLLGRLHRMLKPGGLLIFGHKAAVDGMLGRCLQDRYEEWRMANGYSRAEIDAKTLALKGSMWPMSEDTLAGFMNKNFDEVVETTRMFMFSTLIAIK